MINLRKSYEVVAYTYDADEHCLDCTAKRFGFGFSEVHAFDTEGNPVHPVFLDQTVGDTFHCGTCREIYYY